MNRRSCRRSANWPLAVHKTACETDFARNLAGFVLQEFV